MLESSGIITSTRFKIESALKEKQAFDEKSAADPEAAKVNFQPMLDIMEKSGLISRTPDGRIFMTQKGKDKHIRGFAISNNFPSGRKFVRFSRDFSHKK